MSERDAVWALQQYEAIRSVLPAAHMPKKSVHAENLGEIADLFDTFLLDAFGVLNVGDTATVSYTHLTLPTTYHV